MDFTPLQNIIKDGFKYSCIYNLTGSSVALLLALYDEPFLAVELTEELAEELHKDINFFREALKKEHVFLLPEPDGPSLSGKRAKVVYSLKGKNSIVCSFKNLKSPIWSQKELHRNVINLTKGMEISRTEIEKRLQEIGYKNVSLVSSKESTAGVDGFLISFLRHRKTL